MKVVTAAEMREIEADVVKRGTSLDTLMQRAGTAVARAVAQNADAGNVLILVGPGNNGGDGIIATDALARDGREVTVYTFHRNRVEGGSADIVAAESDTNLSQLEALMQRSSTIVDALLGIGQNRAPSDDLAAILRCVNGHRPRQARALAVDIPTGVNADTGAVPGEAFRADLTIAMGFLKCGHVVYPGAGYCGETRVEDVGIPPELAESVKVSTPRDADIAAMLPARAHDANKGSGGRLLFVGGSHDFLGAPALCTAAAYRAGAGLVEAAVPESIEHSVAGHVPEDVFRPLSEENGQLGLSALIQIKESLGRATAVVSGPGMGHSENTVRFTAGLLALLGKSQIKGALFDADALNALARLPRWWETDVSMVLTPHPGEMARLTGLSVSEIQSDRLSIARRFAAEWKKIVVLKGAGTIVAAPSGETVVNTTGGPNLATAGTGDVLSGIVGGLLAQGCDPFVAATAGVYLHGRAGDLLRREHGDIGTVAGDLPPMIPAARRSILEKREEPA